MYPNMSGFVAYGSLLAVGILCYVFCVIVHRLTLHPLSKYPGPLLAKITDWYNVYHAWIGDRHLLLYDLHQRHGSIVRCGPNRISINTPSSLQQIYGGKAKTRKADWYRVWEMLFGSASIGSFVDPVQHRRRKRIMQPAFTDSALRAMEEHILSNTRTFCDILEEHNGQPAPAEVDGSSWSPPQNLTTSTGFLAYDIMGDMIFSQNFDVQRKRDNRYFVDLSIKGFKGLSTVAYMPLLLKLKLDRIFFSNLHRGMEEFKMSTVDAAVARAKKLDVKTQDIFSFLVDAKDPETGEGLSSSDLQSEAAILVAAAAHPIKTAICALIFHLLHNPATMANLTAEIFSSFSDVESIRTSPALASCHYLRACITEAFRMNPALPGTAFRTALQGGITIDGIYFPEGTDIGTPTYAMQHNETYFPEPFAFKPERWILADNAQGTPGIATEESLDLAKSAWCAFSLGPRVCIGKGMAYQEISIVVAMVLWKFEVRLASEPVARHHGVRTASRAVTYPLLDRFAAESDGPFVEFRARPKGQQHHLVQPMCRRDRDSFVGP